MNKEISKKAFREAEKELEEKEVEKLKEVVKRTLKRINEIDKIVKELQEEKRILKLDIDDLKEGRLDRIEERQEKDPKAKEVSVVKVKEVHHHHYDYWHTPYVITIQEPALPSFPNLNPVWYTTTNTAGDTWVSGSLASGNFLSFDGSSDSFTISNSLAKNNVSGTYLIENKTVHLR